MQISMPTVEVNEKTAFDVKYSADGQPHVTLKVTLIDTPGYGDCTDLTATIVEIVDRRFRHHRSVLPTHELHGMDKLVNFVSTDNR